MVRKLQPCRRMLCRVPQPFESMRSFPACLQVGRSQSSFPYIRVREPKLPGCFFRVCAFALWSPSNRLLKTNQPQRRRGTEDDIKKASETHRFVFLHSPCLCASVAWSPFFSSPLSLILFVADLLHPVDGLTVKVFQNGDVRHRRG